MLSVLTFSGCKTQDQAPAPLPGPDPSAFSATFTPFGVFSKIAPEQSGLAWSSATKRFYVIEDSDNAPAVWVYDDKLKFLGLIKVAGENVDWEDISFSDGVLYVADIGDNEDDRESVTIYSFKEPASIPASITPHFEKIRYSTGPTNAEGLAVHGGRTFILSKNYDGQPSPLFEVKNQVATPIFTLKTPMAHGSLCISPNGKLFGTTDAMGAGRIVLFDLGGMVATVGGIALGQEESCEFISDTEMLYGSEDNAEVVKVTLNYKLSTPDPTPIPTPAPSTGYWKPVGPKRFQIMDEDDGDYLKQLLPATEIVEIEAVKSDYSQLKDQITKLHAKGVKVICYQSLSIEQWRADMKTFPKECIAKKMDSWDESWTDTRPSTCEKAHKFWDKRYEEFAKAGCDAVEDDNSVDPDDNDTGKPFTHKDAEVSVKRRSDFAHAVGMGHIFKNNPSVSEVASKYSDGIMIEGAKRWNKRGAYAPWISSGKFVGSIEYRSQDCAPWSGAVVQYHSDGDYFNATSFKYCE